MIHTVRATATCHPDRPLRAHGRCNACYLRDKRRGRLTLSRPGIHVSPPRAWKGRKAECHPERPHFALGKCRTCYGREQVRAYRATHPARRFSHGETRERALVAQYGLTLADYDRLLAEQGGVCAACGEPPATGRLLDVDHNHRTGRVRGLLCRRCNIGVSRLEDPLAEAWLAYLARVEA